jgi:hypothetical protein
MNVAAPANSWNCCAVVLGWVGAREAGRLPWARASLIAASVASSTDISTAGDKSVGGSQAAITASFAAHAGIEDRRTVRATVDTRSRRP